jgi:hypothetical protein
MLRLMAQGNPFLHDMAAARIIVQADVCTCDDPKARKDALDLLDTWLNTFGALQAKMKALAKDVLPMVLMAKKEIMDKPAADEEGDSSDDDEPWMASAGAQKSRQRRMKPSKVMQRGRWDDLSLKLCRMFDDEDSLRVYCFYGPHVDEKGRLPIIPLIRFGRHEVFGGGVRTKYLSGEVQRPWAEPGPMDLDTAMLEDLIILLAAYEPRLPRSEREMRFVGMSPYLRGVVQDRTLGNAWDTVARLERRQIISVGPGDVWSVTSVDAEDIARLADCWRQ